MVTGFEVVHPPPHEDPVLIEVSQITEASQATAIHEAPDLKTSELKENDTI